MTEPPETPPLPEPEPEQGTRTTRRVAGVTNEQWRQLVSAAAKTPSQIGPVDQQRVEFERWLLASVRYLGPSGPELLRELAVEHLIAERQRLDQLADIVVRGSDGTVAAIQVKTAPWDGIDLPGTPATQATNKRKYKGAVDMRATAVRIAIRHFVDKHNGALTTEIVEHVTASLKGVEQQHVYTALHRMCEAGLLVKRGSTKRFRYYRPDSAPPEETPEPSQDESE